MQRIKKGDMVQVITGNELGIRGEVDRVILAWHVDRNNKRVKRDPNRDKLTVQGVNVRKKHQRATNMRTRTQTGIIDVEMPIHVSNVMVVCPSCDEAVRIGFRVENDRKVRYCKRCDSTIDSY